jgi:hypothetical protein
MKVSPFFVQLGRIVVGYVVAAFVFGMVFSFALALLDDAPSLEDVLILIGTAAVFASIFSTPVALLLVIFSEWRYWRHWGIFAGVGAIAGGIMLSAMFVPGLTEESGGALSLCIMIAGCAASGLTYWAIAGRHAGHWRA